MLGQKTGKVNDEEVESFEEVSIDVYIYVGE